jgi:GT2 family glycosyltransferase
MSAEAGRTSPETRTGHSVAAVVLTYEARAALERCLDAIAGQTSPPGAVLVTDNASPTSVGDLADRYENVTVTRLAENLGPAGGYAAALTAFLATRFEWAWILDDDCVPAPSALAQQLAIAEPGRVVFATVRWAETGEVVRGHGWWGVLIPRSVIQRIGVPDPALFWWTEDTEYLQRRMSRGRVPTVWTEEPVVAVSRARPDASKPAWKYYYEARNQVYHRLYEQRPSASERLVRPRPRHLQLRSRLWRSVRAVSKLAGRAVLREHEDRRAKVAMVARGAFDGSRGKLGRTVVPDSADRPTVGPASGDRGPVES